MLPRVHVAPHFSLSPLLLHLDSVSYFFSSARSLTPTTESTWNAGLNGGSRANGAEGSIKGPTCPPSGCPHWQRQKSWIWFLWRSRRSKTGVRGPGRGAGTIQTLLRRNKSQWKIRQSGKSEIPLILEESANYMTLGRDGAAALERKGPRLHAHTLIPSMQHWRRLHCARCKGQTQLSDGRTLCQTSRSSNTGSNKGTPPLRCLSLCLLGKS